MKENKKVFYDIVRVLGMIMVFLYHFECEIASKGLKDGIWITQHGNLNAGGIGVALFFLVSGSVHRLKYDKEIDVLKYYKKRLISIFPLFYLTYIICAVIKTIDNPAWYRDKNPLTFLLTLICCDGYLPIFHNTFYLVGEWFTTVILVVYILFPIIRDFVKKYPILVYILLAISVLFFYSDYWNPLSIVMDGNLFLALFAFWTGYLITGRAGIYKSIHVIEIALIAVIVIGVFWVASYSLTSWLANYSFAIVIYSLAILVWGGHEGSSKTIRAIEFIAGRSYVIYLSHHFCIRFVVDKLGYKGNLLSFVVSLVMTCLITECVMLIYNKLLIMCIRKS